MSRIEEEASMFIHLISSRYPTNINCILYKFKLIKSEIIKNSYARLIILIQVENYTKEVILDIVVNEFIDFNSLYEQLNTVINELIDKIGI